MARPMSAKRLTYPPNQQIDTRILKCGDGRQKILKTARRIKVVGTDSSMAFPGFRAGGPALGASVHRELQYFVKAGFTPIEGRKFIARKYRSEV